MLSHSTTSLVAQLDPFVANGSVVPTNRRAGRHILINSNAIKGSSEPCLRDHHNLEPVLPHDRASSFEVQNSGAALSPSKD
jgi:hypothetical protein